MRHQHGSQTCTGYRGYRGDCLPSLGPSGTPAFDLNDCDDFLGVRARRLAVAAVASHTCLPPSVSVIVTKLAELRVQTATRVNKGVSAVSERVRVFVAIQAMPPIFSEGSGAGGGREKGAPKRRVVRLKRSTNGKNLRIMMLFEGPAFGCVISPRVSGINYRHDNRIIARPHLP